MVLVGSSLWGDMGQVCMVLGDMALELDDMELDGEGQGLDDKQVPDDTELGDKVHDPPRRIRQ